MSMTERAYEQIKAMILREELAPAAMIDLQELTRMLGLGKSPVREALQRLALEKLIVISPRRGTFVTDLSIIQLQQALDARLVIERHTARTLAERITDRQIAALRTMLADVDRIVDEADFLDAFAVDEKFHTFIAEATGNDYFVDFLSLLLPVTMRFWHRALRQSRDQVATIQKTQLSHRAIIDALATRDPDVAERAMIRHITGFRDEAVGKIMGANEMIWTLIAHETT